MLGRLAAPPFRHNPYSKTDPQPLHIQVVSTNINTDSAPGSLAPKHCRMEENEGTFNRLDLTTPTQRGNERQEKRNSFILPSCTHSHYCSFKIKLGRHLLPPGQDPTAESKRNKSVPGF